VKSVSHLQYCTMEAAIQDEARFLETFEKMVASLATHGISPATTYRTRQTYIFPIEASLCCESPAPTLSLTGRAAPTPDPHLRLDFPPLTVLPPPVSGSPRRNRRLLRGRGRPHALPCPSPASRLPRIFGSHRRRR
jgi:hypothetical protein